MKALIVDTSFTARLKLLAEVQKPLICTEAARVWEYIPESKSRMKEKTFSI